jgi:hypothetical protein
METNNEKLPTIKEVEENGFGGVGYSVNDKGVMSFTDYTGDLFIYEYLGKEYKIVQWSKKSKNKGKQFID